MVPMQYQKQSDILKALGHPVRFKIVEGLMRGEGCNVSKIVSHLNIPQSTVSQHLNVLKASGIIACQREGVSRCYRVVDERVRNIIELMKK